MIDNPIEGSSDNDVTYKLFKYGRNDLQTAAY